MAEILKHPSQFSYQIGKSLIVNNADIRKDVNMALFHYESGLYYNFGQDIGKASSLTLLGLGSQQLKIQSLKVYEQLTQGFLKGALDVEKFSKIEACLSDIETAGGHIENAIDDINMDNRTTVDIFNAITEISAAMSNLMGSLKTCGASTDEQAKLKEMLALFSNPVNLIIHAESQLIINGADIKNEINTAMADYQKLDFIGAGYNMGMATAKTFLVTVQNQFMETLKQKQDMFLY